MATFYAPSSVDRVAVKMTVTLGPPGRGEHTREYEFTAERNGVETLAQLADLMLSACDLALQKAAPEGTCSED